MDQTALVKETIEGGEKLIRKLLERGFELVAGLWAKQEYDSRIYLYLVSPLADIDSGAAYREISQAQTELDQEGLHWLEQVDRFSVKLISPTDPLAAEVLARYRQYPNPLPSWIHGRMYRSSLVETGFLYPPSLFQAAHAAP